MFDGLPAVIDPLQLADEGAWLRGALGLTDMPRLLGVCADNQGSVVVDLHFERDAQGLRRMHGSLQATLRMVCQHCLQPFTHTLCADTRLILLTPGEPGAVTADEADTLVVTKPLPLSEIVEDELLLAMPMIPRHAPGECQANMSGPTDKGRDRRPFATLNKLKRN